jgi:hypothetical protein
MVAPEPGEPLLLYIAATLEAVSMVLVTEEPNPHGLHELESSSANGSSSQDPRPTEEPGVADGSGSQDPGPPEEPGAADGSGSQNPGPVDRSWVPVPGGRHGPP